MSEHSQGLPGCSPTVLQQPAPNCIVSADPRGNYLWARGACPASRAFQLYRSFPWAALAGSGYFYPPIKGGCSPSLPPSLPRGLSFSLSPGGVGMGLDWDGMGWGGIPMEGSVAIRLLWLERGQLCPQLISPCSLQILFVLCSPRSVSQPWHC